MASVSHVTIRKRVALLFLFISVIMMGLIGRLLYLQFYKSAWLSENAIDQRIREIPVEAKRGIIYDRNGRELAVSVSTESVYAIPAEIRNPEETAAKLAAILALDENNLTNKLKKRQAFSWIKRKVEPELARQVKMLNLPGIGLTQESQRYYPHDNLAAHVLGFNGIDSQGLDGVEMTFDSYLKGRSGSIVIEYDARGQEIPHASHRFVPPVEGNNIYLTIDLVIQQIVERELDKVMKETQAKAATIVAIDPRDGGILALANRPDYNPNKFSEFSPKLWRNIAISNTYEPGSTFKIITTSAAMSEHVVKPDERFFDPGEIEVQGRNIHCWKHGGHGSQTFTEVVQNSCNVGFVTVGLRLGRDPFYRYIDAFGFGKQTNVDLPGEAKGITIEQSKATPINIATMAIGQSIAVTPVQLVTAAAAVANDGKLLRPQIVKEVREKSGQVIREFQPDVVRQVMDTAVTKQVNDILESVVSQGSGKNAYIEGFKIAGKTGTAQKVGAGGYSPGKYVASFVGFAPADNPQVAMLVVIDEPVGLYYGGQIAAPVFGAIMKDVLQYLKVNPQISMSADMGSEQAHVQVPSVINLSIPEAVKELEKAGLKPRIEESGERIADQIPKPGSRLPGGGSVLLYTVTPRYSSGEITVPDLTGRTPREAADSLAELGLIVNPIGTTGKVTKQDPLPGSKVLPGTSITIYFE
ncbi:stage V sporulation protein D [Sporomusa acidovorans]|uniref:Stage V sporulation protein D n=1 Tax=Sporomusa acidovorans (strain ATCC 49682 / DSM 3132 / Mol) TaxID=1123286 RepID=A0ABZ3J131_SPOA4|nr:stage V sporulation protein D [Sporomusa acidovorans]OZC13600.1 stage V sporulation protein D [Sporomusa acidovorans DSM 3132]SDE87079.1 stage V sporulation protein D (sporulation-specific penicillin-binding protein) [Sporomusa acidovorans]